MLNSKILDICPNLYVDPFADDSGMSMGAALFHVNKNKFKLIDVEGGLVQGNEDLPTEVKSALEVAAPLPIQINPAEDASLPEIEKLR